jgi:large subunit ribosomal protein L18
MAKKDKYQARQRRKKSIRKRISGTPERPRLSVYRSNKHIYAQVIDDVQSQSLLLVSDLAKDLAGELESCESKVDRAKVVGRAVAKACLDKGIDKVVFDRNGYLYHGRVSALATAAREAGLNF